MDFTFARFALNMAMASSRTEPEGMLRAGAPAFLVGMLSNSNDLVSENVFNLCAAGDVDERGACSRALEGETALKMGGGERVRGCRLPL